MSAKPIHIVFQVLNFLHSEEAAKYKLLPYEYLVLINLASHHGKQGIFPSVKTIAKELHISSRWVLNCLATLEKTKLIIVQKSIGKVNRYTINQSLFITESYPQTSELEFTCEPQITCEPQFTTPVNSSAQTSELQFTRYNKEEQNNNKERARTNRAPLSLPFLPSEENKSLCTKRNLDLTMMVDKFVAHSKADGKQYADEQAAFELFVMREKQDNVVNYPQSGKQTQASTKQPASMPPDRDYKPCNGCKRPMGYCECRLASRETNIRQMGEIFKQLGMTRKEHR